MQETARPATASEDFGLFGAAWDVPAVFWVVGGIDPDTYEAAEKAGKLDELPVNHSPAFAPVIEPTLRTGIEAMLAAAGVWLAGGEPQGLGGRIPAWDDLNENWSKAMNWKAPCAAMTFAALATVPCAAQAQDQVVQLAPATMKRVGTVDERYQSYNVEMLEVTGGRFWKPYKDIADGAGQVRRPGAAMPRVATRPPG